MSAPLSYQAYTGSSACLLCCFIMQPIPAVQGLSVHGLSGDSGCRQHMVFTLKSSVEHFSRAFPQCTQRDAGTEWTGYVSHTSSTLQVVVVDEISSPEEVQAIKSIAQHGIIMVASAPSPSLRSLIGNPELNSLVGRAHQVASGDVHAK